MSKPAKSKTRKSATQARITSSKVVYRGPAFWVTADHVIEPHGIRARRDVVHHTGSVVIIPLDEPASGPRVLLERQYRHAAGQYLWELPAGRIDAGEQPLPAAKRELLEETGYTASRWKRVIRFYASPGFVAETMSIFLARGLKAGIAQPEPDEVIALRFFSLDAALAMVRNQSLKDAKTISGILWLADHFRAARQRK